jgi:hypothetical protein
MLKFCLPIAALVGSVILSPVADDKSSFVTTLGKDTVVIESVTRTSDRVTGDIVVRVPSTVLVHYDVQLRPDGSVARATFDQDPMGNANIATAHSVITFDAEAVHIAFDSSGRKSNVTHGMPGGTMPMLMTGFDASYGLYSSLGLYELALSRKKPSGSDTLKVPSIDIASGAISTRKFLARSATLIDVDYFNILWTHLTVDASGMITAADARGTTEKTETQRGAYLDAAAMAKAFAADDHAGKGLGAASPDLVVKGTIGGMPVSVAYGSPRRRGRTILGNVVLYDRVWRTGANAATTLSFYKPMTIGGATVPPAIYTLWTIPKADGSVTLIINRQHGQWGTDYDPGEDLVKVPMTVSAAPSPQENFAIAITGSGNSGELRMSWDTFVWTVPIALKQ